MVAPAIIIHQSGLLALTLVLVVHGPQTKGWPHSFSPPSFIHWQRMLVVTRWNGFWLLHLPPNAGGNTRREPSTKTNEKSIYLKKLQLPPTCMGQTTYFWILMCCTICIWLFFEDIWARIGLMMEQDMFSMCERGIRGGLTFIAKLKANLKINNNSIFTQLYYVKHWWCFEVFKILAKNAVHFFSNQTDSLCNKKRSSPCPRKGLHYMLLRTFMVCRASALIVRSGGRRGPPYRHHNVIEPFKGDNRLHLLQRLHTLLALLTIILFISSQF